MIQLYALDLTPFQHGRWRDLLPTLPEDRRQRVLACRLDADRARNAGAGWLLQHALSQAGVPAAQQQFTNNQWGKPLLAGREDLHFSLSHGGAWAVCAVANAPVGVDVEFPRCTMAVARRHFHPAELDSLDCLDLYAQKDALNRLWTAKEAFVKALGVGLTIPLDSFQIELTLDRAILRQDHTPLPYQLHEYHPDLHRICLCTTDVRPDLQTVTL